MDRHPSRGPFANAAALYAFLIGFNLLAWAAAAIAFHPYPVLLGTALLAWTLGLRHAVDADHIAAIDNATRKLMRDGQQSFAAGLYFSLGHSTIVVLASVVVAFAAAAFDGPLREFREVGGLVGTLVSAAFLFAVGLVNAIILAGVWRTFRRVRAGGRYVEEDLDILLSQRGVLGRWFRPLFALIRRSWHMYPLGVLFALGFDTASEIGVLGLSAAGAAQGLPLWSILTFPALFTAGMTLVDTTDSVLMTNAYRWATVNPVRKLYYNLTVTFVSVVIAIVVGGIETLGLIGERFGLDQGVWGIVAALNNNFGTLGVFVIGLFATCWIVSAAIYRLKGYDRIVVPNA